MSGATGSFTPQIDGVFVKERAPLYNGHVLFSKSDGSGYWIRMCVVLASFVFNGGGITSGGN